MTTPDAKPLTQERREQIEKQCLPENKFGPWSPNNLRPMLCDLLAALRAAETERDTAVVMCAEMSNWIRFHIVRHPDLVVTAALEVNAEQLLNRVDDALAAAGERG